MLGELCKPLELPKQQGMAFQAPSKSYHPAFATGRCCLSLGKVQQQDHGKRHLQQHKVGPRLEASRAVGLDIVLRQQR